MIDSFAIFAALMGVDQFGMLRSWPPRFLIHFGSRGATGQLGLLLARLIPIWKFLLSQSPSQEAVTVMAAFNSLRSRSKKTTKLDANAKSPSIQITTYSPRTANVERKITKSRKSRSKSDFNVPKPRRKFGVKAASKNTTHPTKLNGWSSPDEQNRFLQAFSASANDSERNDWKIHLNPIGFEDLQAKVNWDSELHSSTLGLPSWVGKKNVVWKNKAWHCWVCIVRPLRGGGFDIIINDSDWENVFRDDYQDKDCIRLTNLMGMQQKFLKWFKTSRRCRIRNVWIGGGGNSSKGNCAELSGNFIRGLTANGWSLPISWDNDGLAAQGYHWVRMDRGGRYAEPFPGSGADKIDGFDFVWEDMPRFENSAKALEVVTD
ncbi:hypothetical protein G7Y89_g9498 [Cudoniella acicularis]|uniref:Uncharacterized protein n=1 Tax=Cudoniella acicularis TaxID=354080 RepID=A0A8H4REJ3_9HELO|nr:hypothetical protein G7Y89_g9498 [Cudoniella acicularis]